MGDVPRDRRSGQLTRQAQDRRRRDRMRAAGPAEAFTAAEIGHCDDWVCGICQDPGRLVAPSPGAPRALSPSVDHVVAVSLGGPHTRANAQIAHLWCNVERGNGKTRPSEYMRARLSLVLDGTPVPEELHRSRSPSWAWPASPRIDFMIALHITAGSVAGDPRHGDPATRRPDTARQWAGNAAAAMQSGLEWVERTRQRQAEIAAWWRSHR